MFQKRIFDQLNKFSVIGLLLIISAYSPGVFKESFWSDDYAALMDRPGFVDHVLKDARPTSAGILSLGFSLVKDPANAWVLRLLALLGLLLVFLLVERSIRKSTHYNIAVLSVAMALCVPSFQMYVHWTITWHFVWAAVAGLYSFYLWPSSQIAKKILAVLFLVLALTAYPPAAVFYFATIAVTNVIHGSKSSKFLRDTFQGVILLAISGVVSMLGVFAFMHFANIPANSRVRLVSISQLPNKVVWLLTRPIVIGLRPFTIDSPSPLLAAATSLPVLIILFFGILRQTRQLRESFFYRVFAVALPLLLTLIPIIATSDNEIEFRLLPGYCWGTAAISVFYLLVEVKTRLAMANLNRTIEKGALLVLSTILSLIAIGTLNLHYFQLFLGPYQEKNSFLNGRIAFCISARTIEKVVIIPPMEPFPSFRRLGVFSMSTDLASPWVPKPNVELLLKERKIDVPVVYLDNRASLMDVTKTECVIDLDEFRKQLK